MSDADQSLLFREAAERGRITKMEEALKAGAELMSGEGKFGGCALHKAALNGHKEACEWLLEKKCKVDPVDQYSCTPLHLAAKGGHSAVVRLLLERGANINAKDKVGRTVTNPFYCGTDKVKQVLEENGGKEVKQDTKSSSSSSPSASPSSSPSPAATATTTTTTPLKEEKTRTSSTGAFSLFRKKDKEKDDKEEKK